MAYFCVSFEVSKELVPEQIIEVKVKPGFKYVGTHMIIDIKMERKFNCNARLVAGVHKTHPPIVRHLL